MYLSLKEYLSAAEKLMKSLGYGNLVNNEDAISETARYMMIADQKFNGNGTRYGFRASYGRYGIMKYIDSQKKRKKQPNFTQMDIDSNKLVDNQRPETSLSINEEVQKSLDVLNLRDKSIMMKRFFDNMGLEEIAKEYGVTKQRIDQIINKSIKKIRDKYGMEYIQ